MTNCYTQTFEAELTDEQITGLKDIMYNPSAARPLMLQGRPIMQVFEVRITGARLYDRTPVHVAYSYEPAPEFAPDLWGEAGVHANAERKTNEAPK